MEKDARLFCRVPARDLRAWKRYARRAGLSFSAWLRTQLPDAKSGASDAKSSGGAK